MKKYSPRECVELFHLLFLDQLGRKIDKQFYAVKGGCNLRFFLNSIRYSQDIDIDIQTIRKDTLKQNVRRILESQPFQINLKTRGFEIAEVTEPKQTDTTQRWKVSLQTSQSSLPLPTKIEFSRRGLKDDVLFGSVAPSIIQQYQLAPIFATHYTTQSAFVQKIQALISRTETQARDVFDLFHLLNIEKDLGSLPKSLSSKIEQAEENALSLSFADFKSQVVAYLPDDYQHQYDDAAMWDHILLHVLERIKESV